MCGDHTRENLLGKHQNIQANILLKLYQATQLEIAACTAQPVF